LQGLSVGNLTALIQSAVAATPDAAAAAGSGPPQSAAEQAAAPAEQQQHVLGSHDLLSLPSADQLLAMMQSRSLTEGIIGNAMSVEMMDGMSAELPSGLMQLNSGLLFGCGERSGMLPPPPSSLFGARTSGQATPGGQAADGAALHMPKAMSLEMLPSSMLHSYSGLLQDLDVLGERDAGQRAAAAATAAAAGAGVFGAAGFGGREGSGGSGLGSNAQAAQRDAAAAAGLGGGFGMRRSGGLDTSMDVGQALDEIMAVADLQQA
jgi:hypothetical protein